MRRQGLVWLFPVASLYPRGRVSGGLVHCRAGECSLIGRQDRPGFGRTETAMRGSPHQGLSLKRAPETYLPEGGGNVVFQIIVMIFLATQEFDICRCPARGDKD